MDNVNLGSLTPSMAAQQKQNELVARITEKPNSFVLDAACRAFFEMVEDDDPCVVWEDTPHRGVIVRNFDYYSLTKAMKAALEAAFKEVSK